MQREKGLPSAWRETLFRVWGHRDSPIFMPAALLVTLDMFDDGDADCGIVEFLAFEDRFQTLIGMIDDRHASKAWEPFFHLSRSAGVWQLYGHGEPVTFDDLPAGRPKSRGRLVDRIDEARLLPPLGDGLQDPGIRARIKQAIYGMLSTDDAVECSALWRAHQRLRSETSPEI